VKDAAILAVLEKATDDGGEPAPRHSRVDEEFALLMTMCARVADAPPPATPAFTGSSAPVTARGLGGAAENWRPVDGAVTTGVSANGLAAPVTSAEKTSFVTDVVHKELGPMRITVERKDGAVRVVFEVQDPIARVAVETQRAALLSSLYEAGVKVASVVVSIRSGGIAFAQRITTTKTKRLASDPEPDVGNDAPSPLNLVG
jgi:Flagellar hook-length control protein FliK